MFLLRQIMPVEPNLNASIEHFVPVRAIAAGLNEQGIPSARGGGWSSPQVMRMLERLAPFRQEEAAAA